MAVWNISRRDEPVCLRADEKGAVRARSVPAQAETNLLMAGYMATQMSIVH